MFAHTFRLPIPIRSNKHHLPLATTSPTADEQKRKEQHANRQRSQEYRHQDKLLDKTRETKLLEIEEQQRQETKLLEMGEQHKIGMTHQQDQIVEEGEDEQLQHRRRLDLQHDTCEEDSVDMIHTSNSPPICSPPAYIYATSLSSSLSQDEMEICRRQSAAAIRRYYSQNSKIQMQCRNTSSEQDDASDAPPHISFDYGSDEEEEEEEEDLNSIWRQTDQFKKEP